jgi:hypothetical protein
MNNKAEGKEGMFMRKSRLDKRLRDVGVRVKEMGSWKRG